MPQRTRRSSLVRGLLRAAVAVAVVAGPLLVCSLAAAAPKPPAAPEPKPALTIAGEDDLELRLAPANHRGKLDFEGDLDVSVYNSGNVAATPEFRLVRDGAGDDCVFTTDGPVKTVADAQVTTSSSASSAAKSGPLGPLLPLASATYRIPVRGTESCVGAPASVLLSGAPSVPVAEAPVTVVRSLQLSDYLAPLVGCAVAFLAFPAYAYIRYWKKRSCWTPPGPSWGFAGSWLTSVSTLSATLGGVLAVSGFTDELLPGVPLGNFLGLGLFFAGLVLVAPMVFSALQVTVPKMSSNTIVWETEGRLHGLFWGGAFTCAGVVGQLVMLGVLARMSHADDVRQWIVVGVLVVTGLLVAWYVVVSTGEAAKKAREPVVATTEEVETARAVPGEPVPSRETPRSWTGTF